MFRKLRLFLQVILSWIIIFACISVIGFILYPLLSEKYQSMTSQEESYEYSGFTIKSWYPLEIQRNKTIVPKKNDSPSKVIPRIDALTENSLETVEKKVTSFFALFKEAFSTNTDKKTVTYSQDKEGVYQAAY